MKDMAYSNYLYTLLDNPDKEITISNEFKFNLYLTLLSLNNHNYHEDIYKEEIDIIENFLRKINNYKVKIQLKRKEKEIDKLFDEIKKIHEINLEIIDKYNKNKLDILHILSGKDSKEITTLIDKLTKEKINKVNDLKRYHELIIKIVDNICKYQLNGEKIIINDEFTLSLDDFYLIFDYLTNINNYKEIFSNEETINSHKELITDIIDIIKANQIVNNSIFIPVCLTYLMYSNIINYDEIATDKFHIDNIKISDLYSLANNKIDDTNKAKWRKVTIPNNYLYAKIKDIVFKGMYYYKDDTFILENIDKMGSDFKISINKDDMVTFIKDNLTLLLNNKIE